MEGPKLSKWTQAMGEMKGGNENNNDSVIL